MPQTYKVKSGDTLSAIAKKLGVSQSQITGYRSGDPNLIYPDEKLQIGTVLPAPPKSTKKTGLNLGAIIGAGEAKPVATTTLNGKAYDQFGNPMTDTVSSMSKEKAIVGLKALGYTNPDEGEIQGYIQEYGLGTASPGQVNGLPQTGITGTSDAVLAEEKAAAEKKFQDEIAAQKKLEQETAQATLDKIKSEITPAGGAPVAPKLLEDYQKLRDEGGIVKIEDEITAIRTEKANLMAQYRAFKRKEPTGVSAGFAAGRISEEGQNIQDRIDFLTRQENASIDRLNNKNKYIETVMKLTDSDYDNAVKRYDTEFAQNIQIQTALNQYKTAEAAEENRLRDDARAYLTSVGNLIKDSGKSWGDIDAGMIADIRKAELRAGYAPGTLEAFARSKPKANLIGSQSGYDASGAAITTLIYDDGSGGIKTTVIKTGGVEKPTTTADITEYEYAVKNENYKGTLQEYKALQKASGLEIPTIAGIQSLLAQDPNITRADLEAQIDAGTNLTKESINELLDAAGAYEFVPQANLATVSNAFVNQIKASGKGVFKLRTAERNRLTAIVQSGVIPLKKGEKETYFRLTTEQQEQILSDIKSKT